jgi:cytochrome c nitrite reductase small subunit
MTDPEQTTTPAAPRRLPRLLALAAAVLTGVLIGAGVFTFAYAEGLSYMSNDPEACVNCHIMNEQYDGWVKGPHKDAATCNDCHVPHRLISKYVAKARNGWHHSSAFTLQDFDEPIRIKPGNAVTLEHNCRTCHQELTADISGHYGSDAEGPECLHCHRDVGHGPSR